MKTNAKMSRTEKLEALVSQLNGLIRRHCLEWDFTFVEILGVLELVKDSVLEKNRALLDELEEEEQCES